MIKDVWQRAKKPTAEYGLPGPHLHMPYEKAVAERGTMPQMSLQHITIYYDNILLQNIATVQHIVRAL